MAEEVDSPGYRVEHHSMTAVVRVTFGGTLHVEKIRRAAHEGIAVGRAGAGTKCLVDDRDISATDATAETYFLMSNVEKLRLLRSDRAAIVYERDRERHCFAELVARNRGWTNLRYSSDMETAKKWLRSG